MVSLTRTSTESEQHNLHLTKLTNANRKQSLQAMHHLLDTTQKAIKSMF